MPYITTNDGTEIYYKDWGNKQAQPVVFSHGWPLSSDDWENQMFFLANQGYRVIGHDRRGHGRSSQPWDANGELDLKDAMMVGHSTGGGEVVRVLGRHGSSRVSKAVLVGAVPPHLVAGVPLSTFDSFREAMIKDRSKFFIDVPSGPFFGFNRPNANVSQGKIWSWWQQGMQCGFKNAYDSIKAFSETDFTQDLEGIDIPVLVLHGDDDQVVPIDVSARKTIKLLKKGTLKEIPGAPHALPTINVDEVNKELLEFLNS
ncbi:hypothetical protein Q7P37_005512 [Cladosporium fusiforme]